MSPRREAIVNERGIVMPLVVFVLAMLTLMSVLLIDTVTSEVSRSGSAVRSNAAFQAAEAGVEDYIAKMVDDRLYYVHQVHPGEATRLDAGGGTAAPGAAWPHSLVWTYPNGFDNWRQLSNGYEYSLHITPPEAGSLTVKIVATGRKVGSTTDQRRVEVLIRPSSIADFQRIVNGDVNWGAGATTVGKLYANGDIDHEGIAQGHIYAEDQITGGVTMQNGAQKYDSDSSPDIRSQIKNPVNFAALLASLVDVQRASQVAGINLDNPANAAWRLTFQSGGTVNVQACSLSGGSAPEDVAPTCAAGTSYAVPINGAIYTGQTAIVSGQVNGRVTVASNDDIIVADTISYVQPGDDVLGLAAKNDVIGPRWAPNNLTWTAGVLAQSGTWRGAGPNGLHSGTMTHIGSSTTNLGGSWTAWDTRNYSYDSNLLFLPPPWFPTIEDAYTTVLFRELPTS
jgi:hypothetical protein